MYRDFYRGNVKVTQELIPGSPNPPSCDAVLDALDTKVDKEEGKGLSSNDFTDADKQKLEDIEQIEIVDNLVDGGSDKALSAEQGKVLDQIKVGAEEMGPAQQVVNEYYNKQQTDSLLAQKQNVIEDLPQLRSKIETSQRVYTGDPADVVNPKEGDICVLRGDVDLHIQISPGYYTEIPSYSALKLVLEVDPEVYVTDIYAIYKFEYDVWRFDQYINEGTTIIDSSDGRYYVAVVKPQYFQYTSLKFYVNVDSVFEYSYGVWVKKFTGSYNDLSDKPLIPTKLSQLSEDELHQVVTALEKQSWNSKYSKPLLGIPESDLSSEVRHILDTALTEEDVANKVDKVPDIAGHYAKFTPSGNLEDGGVPDSAPVQGSSNLISSGAVYTAVTPPEGRVNIQAIIVSVLSFGDPTVETNQAFSVDSSSFVPLSEASSLESLVYYYRGSLSYSLDIAQAYYDVYFDRSDRFIRVRVYADKHITTYWDYKIYSVITV